MTSVPFPSPSPLFFFPPVLYGTEPVSARYISPDLTQTYFWTGERAFNYTWFCAQNLYLFSTTCKMENFSTETRPLTSRCGR